MDRNCLPKKPSVRESECGDKPASDRSGNFCRPVKRAGLSSQFFNSCNPHSTRNGEAHRFAAHPVDSQSPDSVPEGEIRVLAAARSFTTGRAILAEFVGVDARGFGLNLKLVKRLLS